MRSSASPARAVVATSGRRSFMPSPQLPSSFCAAISQSSGRRMFGSADGGVAATWLERAAARAIATVSLCMGPPGRSSLQRASPANDLDPAALGSGEAQAVDGREVVREGGPGLAPVLRDPERAGGRAHRQHLAGSVDVEPVAAGEIVSVALPQGPRQRLGGLAAAPGAGE